LKARPLHEGFSSGRRGHLAVAPTHKDSFLGSYPLTSSRSSSSQLVHSTLTLHLLGHTNPQHMQTQAHHPRVVTKTQTPLHTLHANQIRACSGDSMDQHAAASSWHRALGIASHHHTLPPDLAQIGPLYLSSCTRRSSKPSCINLITRLACFNLKIYYLIGTQSDVHSNSLLISAEPMGIHGGTQIVFRSLSES